MATLNLGTLKVTFGGDTSSLDAAGVKANDTFKKTEASGKAMSDNLSATINKMAVTVSLALTTATYALVKATAQFIEMRNAATSLGISITTMSGLEQAAISAGLATDQLGVSMTLLSKRMQERDWLSEGVRTFDALGISVTDASGKMRTADQVLLDVANRFSTMKDGVEKANIAISLFGDQGIKLIPFLNQGAAKIREVQSAAQDLGGTINGDVQQSYETFYGLQNKMTASFSVFTNQLVEKLLPTFQAMDRWFTSLTGDTKLMKSAVDDAVVVFKALETAGIVVVQTFRNIVAVVKTAYDVITAYFQGVFKVMDALKNFDPRSAYNAIVEGAGKISDSVSNLMNGVWQSSVQTATAIEGVWSGWTTTVTANIEKEAPKWSAPIVKSAQEVSDAFNDMKVGAQNAYGVIMDNPLSTLTQKLDAASDAVRNHAISWREFQNVVRTAKQQYNDQLNDMLNLTGTVLTTMFQKSKAAAIAQALISTYVGITKALETYPPPLSFAMAGLQAALGFAQVRNITSTNQDSAGGASVDTSGAASQATAANAAPNAAPQQTLFVQGISKGSLFDADTVRGLANKLLDYQRDGGRVVLN